MKNKSSYVLSTFTKVYGIENFPYEISYGIESNKGISIARGSTSFFSAKQPYDITKVIWKQWKSHMIPFFFDSDSTPEILTYSRGTAQVNYDIIASAFFLLSNWQELYYENKKKNNNSIQRFQYADSVQCKLNIIEKPIVNYYFEILKEAIENVYNVTLKQTTFSPGSFCTYISHDIDTCETGWLQGGYSKLKSFKLLSLTKLLLQKIFKKDTWFNFEQILTIENKLGITSTFFFLCENQKFNKHKNADYNIKHKKFRKVFKQIDDNNSEIGIHASIGSCSNLSKFSSEVSRLERTIYGNRFHFLEFNPHTTTGILEKANIKYDSTMGFAEHFGFRNSFCLPFYLYDIENDRSSDVLEIPLILMDGTLQNKKYLNVKKEEVQKHLQGVLDEIIYFNGLFTVLWHNTHYSDEKYGGWKEVILSIIQNCKDRGSIFLNGNELRKLYGNNI